MKKLVIAAFVVAAAIAAWMLHDEIGTAIYRFEGVEGPSNDTQVAPAVAEDLGSYDKGGSSRLAVLVTDPASDWLGLVRGFKAHGIPFTLTQDPKRALRHDVVLTYPTISGRVLSAEALRGLADHVRSGGTVLTFDLAGGGLEELFGIASQEAGRGRSEIRWLDPSLNPGDRLTRFNARRAEVQIGTNGIEPTTAERYAGFDDGTAAAVCRRVGGRACILGIDVGALTNRAMNGRAEQVSAQAVNTYDPSLDIIYRWIRDLYVEGEARPYLIETAPAGRAASLILTHDVDFSRSVFNASLYAKAIRDRGQTATFFIQTKVIRDWNDDVFFNDSNLERLRETARGMELGSHSVSHSRMFSTFPTGSGSEHYPDYRPFVENASKTRDGTLLGELRVSRFLLQKTLGTDVASFRPGYLANHAALPEALAATGYRYSSTLTANLALTHLPYQLTYSRSDRALVPIWEFPVTIEDEKSPRLGDRFDAAVTVIDNIARNGGVAVVLIHPDVTGHKLAFEELLIDHYAKRLWIGSLAKFGKWWTARSLAEVDYDGKTVTVDATEPIADLVIRFPKGGRSVVLNGKSGTFRVAVAAP
ncbi:polysaccharide deacetylase family protein [uncultured Erythrobacter sp.]|uniref:polysaccharide deacetylase family protein n=1 Tax=uncultured Erythrobacter sp. TaxID=263913 RepID=UPI0026589B96|nr:polysaccharide deacetylase family protein [uncultured Erythrobacter sp.]